MGPRAALSMAKPDRSLLSASKDWSRRVFAASWSLVSLSKVEAKVMLSAERVRFCSMAWRTGSTRCGLSSQRPVCSLKVVAVGFA